MSETLLSPKQQVTASEQDDCFYHEMMAHPVLFTHRHPQKVAIIGNEAGIAAEVLKHATVQAVTLVTASAHLPDCPEFTKSGDTRLTHYQGDAATWISQTADESFDVIILTQPALASNYQRLLHKDGFLVQPHQTTWLSQENWQAFNQTMQQAGFSEWQLFHFPQPGHPAGWRFAIMANKTKHFKRPREKDIFNRNFTTRYYNLDMHKSSLALPEFIRSMIE